MKIFARAGCRSGSVMMETIFTMPLVMLLVLMVLQYAHIWMARQITAYAAFCATRATLGVPDAEQEHAARKAAELACGWISLVNLESATGGGGGSSETVHTARLVGEMSSGDHATILAGDETVKHNDGAGWLREIVIRGWGAIPGSDSASVRVQVAVETGPTYAFCKVRFKFPLVFPVVGSMISWFANHPPEYEESAQYDSQTGTWSGDSYYSVHKGWNRNRQTVMTDTGEELDREGADYMEKGDGKYPFIELSDSCVLPRAYLASKLPANGYRIDFSRVGEDE